MLPEPPRNQKLWVESDQEADAPHTLNWIEMEPSYPLPTSV